MNSPTPGAKMSQEISTHTQFHDPLVQPGTADLPEKFFDRFMFNGHPVDQTSPSFILGLGIYPPRDVVDGFLVFVDGKEQRNLRFSTELSSTDGSSAGPLHWQTVEANKTWKLSVGPNPSGVECNIIWEARTPAWFGKVGVADGDKVTASFDHLFQSGHYTGELTVDGVQHTVDGWYGQRDRSRGVRTMKGGQGLHLWYQAQFEDRSVGFLLVEDRQGGRLLLEGAVMHVDGRLDLITSVDHDLVFTKNHDLISGGVRVSTESGCTYQIEADASAGGGYMAGAGYGDHHGKSLGRDQMDSDRYPLDGSVNPGTLDSALTDRVAAFRWDGKQGTGIFEFARTRSSSYTYSPSWKR